MKNQLKAGVIFSYISTGITVLIQLIYLPIMIRILGQSEYGLYSVVSGVVSYLSLFSLGFSGAYLRFFSRFKYQDDKKKLASLNGMFIILFWHSLHLFLELFLAFFLVRFLALNYQMLS